MKYRDYALPATLEEAWALNQRKSNRVIGGTLWMRMSKLSFGTAIDLSALGLDRIEEVGDEIRIGCMVSLHQLEISSLINDLCGGGARQALEPIVGIQFRNCATVGGSIFGRYGFSDVLTLFMALDAQVELYKAGRMPVCEFAAGFRGRDILTHVIIRKRPVRLAYLSQRNSKTDFPVLTCAVCEDGGHVSAVIGARPMRAVRFEKSGMDDRQFIDHVKSSCVFGTNMRGSAEYRRHIAGVLLRRGLEAIREAKA